MLLPVDLDNKDDLGNEIGDLFDIASCGKQLFTSEGSSSTRISPGRGES